MSNPAATAEKVPADRRRQINDATDIDVSREAYLDTVFKFPEVRYVELAKFTAGLQSAPLLQKIERGFNPPGGIDELILSTWKAGQYRLSSRLVDGTIAAPRIFALGDMTQNAGVASNGAAPRSADEVQVSETVADLARYLKTNLSAEQLMDMSAQLQTRRMNREIEPMRLVMEAFDKLAGRAVGGGSDKLVDLLMAELKDVKQEMRDERRAREDAAKATTVAAPVNPLALMGETIRQAREAGAAIGMVERSVTAEAAKPEPSGLEIAERVLDKLSTNPILTPLANTLTRLLEYKLAGVLPPSLPAAPPNGATAATPGGQPVVANPEQARIIAAFREAIAFFKSALESEDFETCRWMLYNQFVTESGLPIIELNPKVPAGAYMIRLKQIDPEFATLQPKVEKFLAWAREQSEGKPESPA